MQTLEPQQAELAAARKSINDQILQHYLTLDNRGNFLYPPRTDDELDEFIQLALGVRIPRKVITPGHRSPFEFVADLFFERVKNALGFANRTGGKTLNVAIINFLDMLFKPGCEVASAGATLSQADKCYRYFRDFHYLPWVEDLSWRYSQITGTSLYDPKRLLKSGTEYGNRSLLELVTGSEKGLRSPHPNKARVDEIDLIEWDTLQTGLSMAQSSHGIRGQNVFTSTRQLAQGSMQRLLDSAHEKGIVVYQWDVWETVQKCQRRCKNDRTYGDCPIYVFCKGVAHRCDGYFDIDDFVDKIRLLDRDKFDTEWLNKRPSRHRLVYHQFDHARHVMTPDRLFKAYNRHQADSAWYRIGGIDFGSSPGHPFVYLQIVQLPDGAWLIYHEYYAEQRLMRDHARAIKSIPGWAPSQLIFADWDAQDRLELKAEGVPTQPATKGAGSVNMGIDYICELLSGYLPNLVPRLFVWHTCKETIREWGAYSWPLGDDGRPRKEGNPLKFHDHTSDATRMALFSYKHKSKRLYTPRRIAHI